MARHSPARAVVGSCTGLQGQGSGDRRPNPTYQLAHAQHAATSQLHNGFENLLLPTHPHSGPRAYCMLRTPPGADAALPLAEATGQDRPLLALRCPHSAPPT